MFQSANDNTHRFFNSFNKSIDMLNNQVLFVADEMELRPSFRLSLSNFFFFSISLSIFSFSLLSLEAKGHVSWNSQKKKKTILINSSQDEFFVMLSLRACTSRQFDTSMSNFCWARTQVWSLLSKKTLMRNGYDITRSSNDCSNDDRSLCDSSKSKQSWSIVNDFSCVKNRSQNECLRRHSHDLCLDDDYTFNRESHCDHCFSVCCPFEHCFW